MTTASLPIERVVLDLLARMEIDGCVEGALASLGEAGEAVLLRVARGEVTGADGYQRGNAVYLVGRRSAKGVSGELAKLLDRETVPRIRLSTVNALGRIGDPTARKALLGLLLGDKPDRNELMYALDALAQTGAPEDLPALEAARFDPSFPPLDAKREQAVAAIKMRSGSAA